MRAAERLTYATANVVLVTNQTAHSVALGRGGKREERVFMVRTAPKNPAGELPSRPRTKKRQLHLIGYVGVRAAPTAASSFGGGRPIGKQAGRRDMQFL